MVVVSAHVGAKHVVVVETADEFVVPGTVIVTVLVVVVGLITEIITVSVVCFALSA